VPVALVSGEADAAVSDSLEAPVWMAEHPGLVLLGPFTRDRKAYLMPSDSDRLATDLDAWLLAREADGSLERLRRGHLGAAAAASTGQAAPLRALLASLDERLSLMPLVAEAKARLGLPVEDRERESRVLAAAVADASETRCPAPLPGASPRPLEAESVRALFQAQIDAARAMQHAEFAKRPPAPDAADTATNARQDLETRLRPALLRIGARMTRLLSCLPEDLDAGAVEVAVQLELGARDLPEPHRRAIAEAIVRVARRGASQQTSQ
jgi:cyclohexadienyl dehydratase